MKTKVKIEQEIEVSSILITVPVRYEEEDIPNDFPLRSGAGWAWGGAAGWACWVATGWVCFVAAGWVFWVAAG